MRGLADEAAQDRRADEAIAARDENSLRLGQLTPPEAFSPARAFDAARFLSGR